MTRLNLDNLSALLAMETMLSPPGPPASAAEQTTFDEHLLRAQSATATTGPADSPARDAGRPLPPESPSTEYEPARSAREDARGDSGAPGSPGDPDGPGTADGTISGAGPSAETQDDHPGESASAQTDPKGPEASQGEDLDPKAAGAAEAGAAESGTASPDACDDEHDPQETAEHPGRARRAGRQPKGDAKGLNKPECAEATPQGEPEEEAAPFGREENPTEGAVPNPLADHLGPAEETGPQSDRPQELQNDGPEDAAARRASPQAEVQAAWRATGPAPRAVGLEGEASAAGGSPSLPMDVLPTTQPMRGAPRRAASRAVSAGPDQSAPVSIEPGRQPAIDRPEGMPAVKLVDSLGPVLDPQSGASGVGKRGPEATTPADGPAPADDATALADAAAAKREQQAARPGATDRNAPAPGSDQADRVRFVQRVARAFETAAERGGTVRLRLHPPELGSLRLELTLRNGKLSARLEAETEAARNLIVDNFPALRDRLAEHQIRVERFDVDWGNRPADQPPQQAHDQAASQSGHSGRRAPATTAAGDPAAGSSGPRAAPRPGYGSRFDVII